MAFHPLVSAMFIAGAFLFAIICKHYVRAFAAWGLVRLMILGFFAEVVVLVILANATSGSHR